MNAREIMSKHFKGSKNFMTPNIVEVDMATDSIAYEISSGKGFTGNKIYGLTFVKLNEDGTTKHLHDISKCCDTVGEARTAIADLN